MTLIAERTQNVDEDLLELIVYPKRLEHREAHCQQGDQGEQGRIDQTHRAEVKLTVGELVNHRVYDPQQTNVGRLKPGHLGDIHLPHRLVESGFDFF